MNADTREKVQQALDALWSDYGNGTGTPLERLIAELQIVVDTTEVEPEGKKHEAKH